MAEERIAEIKRETKETTISLNLNLDGEGKSTIDTGVPFFNHMMELFSRHGLFDVELKATGDLEIDYHHVIEDIGIVLGQAVKEAVGDKRGIFRYGFFFLPMDETMARVILDIGGRSTLVYRVECREHFVRDFNIGLLKEFFQAFANNAGANVHINLEYGQEPHHIAEAIFKGFGRTLDMATRIDSRQAGKLPTTKGKLD